MQLALFMYSNINGLTPKLLPNFFKTNFDVHQRNTRASFKLCVNFARTKIRSDSLSIAAPPNWNVIPNDIKLAMSPLSSKLAMKKWLLSPYVL